MHLLTHVVISSLVSIQRTPGWCLSCYSCLTQGQRLRLCSSCCQPAANGFSSEYKNNTIQRRRRRRKSIMSTTKAQCCCEFVHECTCTIGQSGGANNGAIIQSRVHLKPCWHALISMCVLRLRMLWVLLYWILLQAVGGELLLADCLRSLRALWMIQNVLSLE